MIFINLLKQKFALLLIFNVLMGGLMAQEKRELSLEDIFKGGKFSGKEIQNIQWNPNHTEFTFTERSSDNGRLEIFKHSIKTGEREKMLGVEDLSFEGKAIAMSSYQWTDDGQYILIAGKVNAIWRHSTQAPHYLYHVKDEKLVALAQGDKNLRNVKLSPDGQWVGYVKSRNLYIFNLEREEEIALTDDGNENILNGEFDWVYEEEFGLADAWRWSPDSKKIAYWKFDQERVKTFYLVDEMGQYNSITPLKYPKAGEQNAIVNIAIYDLASKSTQLADLGKEDDMYIPRIFWTNSSDQLAILRMNRLQNHLELMLSQTKDGKGKVIIEDRVEGGWIDVRHDISFLKNTDQIIWTSERSGFNHAYLYDYSGKLVQQLTEGEWEITDVQGVDEKNKWVYFSGKKDGAIQQHLYRVNFKGKRLSRISKGEGWHTANFSKDFQHYVGRYTNGSTPTQIRLHKSDGSEIRVLEENKIEALSLFQVNKPEYFQIETSDGVKLNAYMIKPADFDPEKKYPVLVHGYGGPGSQIVVNRWMGARALWHSYMADQGYLVFVVDNRGTGGRGRDFKHLAYGDLSKWAVKDQLEGANYLSGLDYVDASRIGFWGWSGGGYLTLMMLTRGADQFKVGVSVAPVSDFRFYDTIWTERYMGLPQENEEGYTAANAIEYARQLEGKLMIIHGTGDDNVHYQNAVQMIDALQDELKAFDMMFYANRNHGIYGGNTSLHLYQTITKYFLNYL